MVPKIFFYLLQFSGCSLQTLKPLDALFCALCILLLVHICFLNVIFTSKKKPFCIFSCIIRFFSSNPFETIRFLQQEFVTISFQKMNVPNVITKKRTLEQYREWTVFFSSIEIWKKKREKIIINCLSSDVIRRI